MKSELKALRAKLRADEEALRARCPHKPSWVSVRLDRSVVGCGSAYPSVHVTCRNCGARKIIFGHGRKEGVEKRLDRQGFDDERTDLSIAYEWELD